MCVFIPKHVFPAMAILCVCVGGGEDTGYALMDTARLGLPHRPWQIMLKVHCIMLRWHFPKVHLLCFSH